LANEFPFQSLGKIEVLGNNDQGHSPKNERVSFFTCGKTTSGEGKASGISDREHCHNAEGLPSCLTGS